MKLLSIVIPAYNAEKTIGRCLDSIVNQTNNNYEVIIVNDGSKDNTLNICNDYKNNYNNISVINNSNHGISYSRNCGILHAKGDYVTFIDSDDTIDLDTVDFLYNNISDDLDFLRYNFKNIDGNGFDNTCYFENDIVYDLDKNREMIARHFIHDFEKMPNLVMLLVIKKSIIQHISFNEKLVMMEDVDYYNQLFFASKKCRFIDNKKYNYFINPESVTHKNTNLKKNVLGIIDTNYCVEKRIKDKFNLDTIKKMNSNHLRVITNMLVDYSIDAKNIEDIISKLNEKDNYIKMINNYDFGCLPIRNKILVLLLINKRAKTIFACKKIILFLRYIKHFIKR